jgi:predicted HicB family RNase H-like nuclease
MSLSFIARDSPQVESEMVLLIYNKYNRGRSENMMEYKGYIGKVDLDDEAGIFHGEVINTRDVITFQGQSLAQLKKEFRESVDDYLAFCAARGEQPDKPFSGQFVTRVPPELHRQVNLAARISGKSLNAWVADQLKAAVARTGMAGAGKAKRAAKRRASGTVETMG